MKVKVNTNNLLSIGLLLIFIVVILQVLTELNTLYLIHSDIKGLVFAILLVSLLYSSFNNYTFLLTAFGGIVLGYSLNPGRLTDISDSIEVAFGLLILYCSYYNSIHNLKVGYVLHLLWVLSHHHHITSFLTSRSLIYLTFKSQVSHFLPTFCLVLDIVVLYKLTK